MVLWTVIVPRSSRWGCTLSWRDYADVLWAIRANKWPTVTLRGFIATCCLWRLLLWRFGGRSLWGAFYVQRNRNIGRQSVCPRGSTNDRVSGIPLAFNSPWFIRVASLDAGRLPGWFDIPRTIRSRTNLPLASCQYISWKQNDAEPNGNGSWNAVRNVASCSNVDLHVITLALRPWRSCDREKSYRHCYTCALEMVFNISRVHD